jgi:fucose permease
MGWIADSSGMALGFIVPLVCFAYILFYGIKGFKFVAYEKNYEVEISKYELE